MSSGIPSPLPIDMFRIVTRFENPIYWKQTCSLLQAAIDKGGDPNAVNEEGVTLLIFTTLRAIQCFRFEVVDFLAKRVTSKNRHATFENKMFLQWVGYRGELSTMRALAECLGMQVPTTFPLCDKHQKRQDLADDKAEMEA